MHKASSRDDQLRKQRLIPLGQSPILATERHRVEQIFISYRRGPTGYVATLLAEELRDRFGAKSVFMDVDTIPYGVDFRDHIHAAVSECQVLLVLIGDDWLTSKRPDGQRRLDASDDFVRVEIEAALQRSIPVVPILTDAATMPGQTELPPSLRPLAFRNAAELRSGSNLKAQMQGLLGQLSLISKDAPTNDALTARGSTLRAAPRLSRRYLGLAAICALAAAAALCWFVVRRENSRSSRGATIHEVVLQTPDAAGITLYRHPDPHSESCGALRRGSSVLILETFRHQNGEIWNKVSLNPGWIAARNLAEPDYAMLRPTTTTTLQIGQPAVIAYTGSDGLNLRESPNLQSRVIAYLLVNTAVTITNDKLVTNEHEWWGVEIPPSYIRGEVASP
ncbi:MAG: TIR domain-containing protein [Chthoniobacterales bacterium]